jgi:hypothetical protein
VRRGSRRPDLRACDLTGVTGIDRPMKTVVTEPFTQTDPLQPTVGQAYPSSYVYANNNPNMYVDPSGLRAVDLAVSGLTSRNPIVAVEFGLSASLLQSGLRIPGVNWCVGSCTRSSLEKNVGDPTTLKYIDALKKESASRLGVPGLIKIDKMYQSFLACSGQRKDRKCLQKLISMTFTLGPSGTVVGSVGGGPAHAALYGLINETTDFSIGQFEVVQEALDGGGDLTETEVTAEGAALTVRSYAKGYVHVRKRPSQFFHRLGEK